MATWKKIVTESSSNTIAQATTGNAATATALANGRTIGMTGDVVWTSASFDGSGNVTGSATIQANSVALATDTTGNYVATVADAGTGGITVANSGSENAGVTLEFDINGLTAAAIASGDQIAFSDEGATGDPSKKESIDDIATLFAGTGLTASSAVISIDAAQTGITSLLVADIKIGEDDETKIDFETADTINFYAGNEKQLILTDGALTPGANNILDLGSNSVEFKDAYFDGTVTADAFAGPLTGNVTGNASGTAATVTGAAQSNITSLGTLTTLSVDNITVNGNDISSTDTNGNITLTTNGTGKIQFNDLAYIPQQAITSSSNAVAWDTQAKPNAYHITTENTTFSAPSNGVEGAFICLEINYNGSHTIGWNTVFEFPASTEPTETATDGKTDIHVFRYNGAIWQEIGRSMNLSES